MDTEKIRVRALLFCRGDGFILIRRTKPGEEPYFVFPGGGRELSDDSDEAALRREIEEEIGVRIRNVRKLGTVVKAHHSFEHFFYAECDRPQGGFVGQERHLEGRGGYELVTLRDATLVSRMKILPHEAVRWLNDEMEKSA